MTAAVTLLPLSAPAQDFGGSVPSHFHDSPVVLLVSWVSTERVDKKIEYGEGYTTYKIVKALENTADEFKAEGTIRVPYYRQGKPGQEFVMMGIWTGRLGKPDRKVQWVKGVEATPKMLKYIREFPIGEPDRTRLAYHLEHLEHEEAEIALDSFREISGANKTELDKLASQFPRKKLLQWLADPGRDNCQAWTYGPMIGLCGRKEDLELFEKVIADPNDIISKGTFKPLRKVGVEPQIGGMMAGYVLLAGEPGLTRLEELAWNAPQNGPSKRSALSTALSMVYERGAKKVEKERVLASMRRLLDEPAAVVSVIRWLERWQDWSVQERVMKLYPDKADSQPRFLQGAVISYILASQEWPDEEKNPPPAHVVRGRELLGQLRQRDARSVRQQEQRRKELQEILKAAKRNPPKR